MTTALRNGRSCVLKWHPQTSDDRYPWLTSWSILDRHSINTSVDTQSTRNRHLGQQLTNFQFLHISQSTLGRLSTDCWWSVNWVSTKYWLGCRSSTNWDVDRGYWSRISIDTRPHMPLVHGNFHGGSSPYSRKGWNSKDATILFWCTPNEPETHDVQFKTSLEHCFVMLVTKNIILIRVKGNLFSLCPCSYNLDTYITCICLLKTSCIKFLGCVTEN